ncbi:uncharacterized protein LOC107042095 [Diachasma alloeum]|uniref:uncharacterized protein LOC107042095 n=1 Tax=Diachasma alloeum TaxID=454923 RepID=UPI00073817B4|nr:uncharacterized protein LOC107042095 [Diachasma alloeum]
MLTSSTTTPCNVVKLDKLIERFWYVEDFDHEPVRSRDEISCEQHYVTHTKCDVSGRYIIRLPFRDSKLNLGESRRQPLKRFSSLDRKLSSNPPLKSEYIRVMEEYISLGHMTLCDETEGGYYLPHHAVIKDSSETTKVRVVFDASAKTSTGISLNDTLLVGPTIQNTIFEQVLRFRTHRYVITADIEKMYRQILVHPDDRQFQKVLWPYQGNLRTFQLNTVTFGTAAAPFLAVRTIQQLARDEAHDFPRASKLLLRDFYVDDFISGADSLDELLTIRDEMIALLSRGGFIIRQWSSNHRSALNTFDKKFFDLDCLIKNDPVQKTLGIIWDAQNDLLRYTLNQVDTNVAATKRKLLSELSKIFDPLGLLGPVTLFAKVLIQDCWKAKITWDESLPQDIHTKWTSLALQLPRLQEISFPRQILILNHSRVEIHGFCDASIHGYGACLYIKSSNPLGDVSIKLVCSKLRVAPLSGLTIPRLELCAATILKRLYLETKAQLDFSIDQVYLWSDSTIVLCWLKEAPHLLRTFESNRVADIQELGNQVSWRHVRSEDNPADALSRGQLPSDFVKNSLWTSSPRWLILDQSQWPQLIEPSVTQVPGLKKSICLLTNISSESIYTRFSNFERLHERFSIELRRLSTTQSSEGPVRSYLKGTPFDQLHPFVDDKGILRVGGRLKRSELSYNQKHPILLPSKHPVTDMIIRQVHQSNLHKPKLVHAQMADLPRARVNEAPAFSRTGVDFFGPILIKEKKDRNRSFLKAYGCVFVCMVSKAVHIELATDLSTEGFLSAFQRFVSRRGVPEYVDSDNADPNDPLAITPAHLLIGRPFNALPDKSFISVPDNRLSRYNFITKAKQDFWNKWHKEYLHELQTRHKWHDSTAELKLGSVVLLMDDLVTCARWPLGVIVEVFPGSDGIVRVASVKTAGGIYKQNITRLCLLPVT